MSIKKVFVTYWNFNKILSEDKNWEEYIEIRKLRFLPNSYLKFISKYINSIKNQQFQPISANEKNSNEWVFEWWNKPVYHLTQNCSRLHSNYENYRISNEILREMRKKYPNMSEKEIDEKWEKIKEDFKKWVLNRLQLLKTVPEDFFNEMRKEFWVWKFGEEINRGNTWTKEFYWASLTEIEEELNRLIKNRNDLVHNEYTRIEKIIIQFLWNKVYFFKKEDLQIEWEHKEQDEKTFWKKIDEYYNWNENYKGMIVSKNHKNILKNYWYENIIKLIYSYDDNNIQKIKDLLIFYINAKYNPNLSFDEEVLKDLWFIVCNECTKEVH